MAIKHTIVLTVLVTLLSQTKSVDTQTKTFPTLQSTEVSRDTFDLENSRNFLKACEVALEEAGEGVGTETAREELHQYHLQVEGGRPLSQHDREVIIVIIILGIKITIEY